MTMSTGAHGVMQIEAQAERDPVCGMSVGAASPHQAGFEGRTYRFCGAGCKAKFTADPHRYLSPSTAPPLPKVESAEWTCPMHPEIVRDAPGSCPLCGMALEPRTISAIQPENPQLVAIR